MIDQLPAGAAASSGFVHAHQRDRSSLGLRPGREVAHHGVIKRGRDGERAVHGDVAFDPLLVHRRRTRPQARVGGECARFVQRRLDNQRLLAPVAVEAVVEELALGLAGVGQHGFAEMLVRQQTLQLD